MKPTVAEQPEQVYNVNGFTIGAMEFHKASANSSCVFFMSAILVLRENLLAVSDVKLLS